MDAFLHNSLLSQAVGKSDRACAVITAFMRTARFQPTTPRRPWCMQKHTYLWNASVKESAIYGKLIGCAPVDLLAHAADDCLGEKLRAERVENAVGRRERGKRASRQKLPRGGQAPCECCVSGRSPRSRAAALAWCSVQRLA